MAADQRATVMENKTNTEKVLRFKLPKIKRKSVFRGLVVLTLAAAGTGMVMAGLLAWVVGEHALLVTGVVGGAILVSASGLGMLSCLEE